MTKGRWLSGTERLIADFGSLGLWEYHKPAGWANLTGEDPDFVIAADINADGIDEIAADFGASGLWMWNGVWTQISMDNPD